MVLSIAVKRRRDKAKAEIDLLNRGILPSERSKQKPPPSDNEVLDSAATASNAAHIAAPTLIKAAVRNGGAKASQAGVRGGGQAGTTRAGEQLSPAPPPPGAPGGGDSDEEEGGGEEEDEEARSSNYYAIPDVAKKRVKEVTLGESRIPLGHDLGHCVVVCEAFYFFATFATRKINLGICVFGWRCATGGHETQPATC